MKELKTETVSIRVDAETKEQIYEKAKSLGLTASKYMLSLIMKDLGEQK